MPNPGEVQLFQELFVRRERRWRVAPDRAQSLLKDLRGRARTRSYHVQTVYLAHPGKPGVNCRLRRYNGAGPWFYEEKTKVGRTVHKERSRANRAEIAKQGFTPLAVVRYHRTEWEHEGVRITVDRNVRSFAGEKDRKPAAQLKHHIVEAKTMGKPPTWLHLSKPNWSSKLGWALRSIPAKEAA